MKSSMMQTQITERTMEQGFPKMKELDEFTQLVISVIKAVPFGKVATYGQIANFCGKPTGARQVSRILHSCTKKHSLPWHRVINSKGKISLPAESGELQTQLLQDEGIEFSKNGSIDLNTYAACLSAAA